jgi:hypothetical protein
MESQIGRTGKDRHMAMTTVIIPEVELTLNQLLAAIRQLEPDARTEIAQALQSDEMDERLKRLINRLETKPAITDITIDDINDEIREVRRQAH